jgi:hypothetical protein
MKDLKPALTDNLVRSWKSYVEEQGYQVKAHFASDAPADRHIVLYSDPGGDLQAVLSDSDQAKHVKPISRLSISKAKAAKAGERQEA